MYAGWKIQAHLRMWAKRSVASLLCRKSGFCNSTASFTYKNSPLPFTETRCTLLSGTYQPFLDYASPWSGAIVFFRGQSHTGGSNPYGLGRDERITDQLWWGMKARFRAQPCRFSICDQEQVVMMLLQESCEFLRDLDRQSVWWPGASSTFITVVGIYIQQAPLCPPPQNISWKKTEDVINWTCSLNHCSWTSGGLKLRLKSSPHSPTATHLGSLWSSRSCSMVSGLQVFALWGWTPAVK